MNTDDLACDQGSVLGAGEKHAVVGQKKKYE
jgi:hypothetical protein